MKYILEEGTELFNKQLNKYSFPFNGLNNEPIERWCERLEPFAPFIHDIYCSLPDINGEDHFSVALGKQYLDDCAQLLDYLCKTQKYKAVVTLNGNYTNLYMQQKQELCKQVVEQVKKYNIYGCVVSDFSMACILNMLVPNLVLNTSCNVPQYSVEDMLIWKEYANIEVINPSRNSSRDIPLLKEFKEHGFKVKLLLNELCDIHCPNMCMHCARPFDEHTICFGHASKNGPLHSCFVLPRWLNILDEYVDIYKLTGRYNRDINFALKQFVYYLLRTDNCDINEFYQDLNISIPLDEFPDKLLYCQGKCSNCSLCIDIYKQFFNKMNFIGR